MSDRIDSTLKLWRTTPFAWGERDCMLSIGDYIAECGGLNVASLYRGSYSDEAGALAHLTAAGGACALVDATGLLPVPVGEIKRGDVVVIDAGDGEGVGALCTGEGIAARLERGVIEVNRRMVHIVKAWACPR